MTPVQVADMARYFFNLVGEYVVNDRDGVELPDIESARGHAIELAQALMGRARFFRAEPARWSIQIVDADGHDVAAVAFLEASMLKAGSTEGDDRAGFSGRLCWKAQLHLGEHMGNADRETLDQELPERFGELLRRLEQASKAGTIENNGV